VRRVFPAVVVFQLAALCALGWMLCAPGESARRLRPMATDGAQGYAEYRHMLRADERGQIPPDGLIRANAQAEAMRAASVDAKAAGITTTGWTWLGPGNIGGRVRALVIAPTQPAGQYASVMFAGAVDGGIWKTTNGGTTWAPVDDFMANLAVSCLIYQPGSPSIMWAGTGEGFYNYDAIQGAGIFKSSDGGTTWAQVASTATTDFLYVNRIAISADGGTIVAATNTGLFRSINAGASWTKVLNPSTITPAIYSPEMYDVRFLPGSNLNVVAGGRYSNAYYSTNGGASWTLSAGPTVQTAASSVAYRVEIGVSVSSPSIVYLSIGIGESGSGRLWRSADGGATYASKSDLGGAMGSQSWYDNAVWVDPTNANWLAIGGVYLTKSKDGGDSALFREVMYNASIHSDHHVMVSDPGYNGTSNTRVYFGGDGGVYRSDNLMSAVSPTSPTFTSLNHNLGITQFFGGGGNAASGKIVGGTQDNFTLMYNPSSGSDGWAALFGGDGGFAAADSANANYFYGETTYLEIHRNSTGGVSQSDYIYGTTTGGFPNQCKAAPYRIDDACDTAPSHQLRANFIAPFVLDPNQPARLLAGGASLWRTDDVRTANASTTGPSWTAIKPPTVTDFNYINAIAVAPGNSNIVWVGHNLGDVYMTTNGTVVSPTWTKVSTALMPARVVTRLAVDPLNSSNVYASFGGFSANNVWRTTDSGATWSVATGSGATGLPNAPVYGLAVHPTKPAWIYAATEVGIFASTDRGATWSLPHDGPANTSINELFWMGTTLVAVTHGRGLYRTTSGVETGPPFTDNPLAAGTTAIKAVHFVELRGYINTLRARYPALSPFSWTNAIAAGSSIRAIDLTELRAALVDVYDQAHLTRPAFSPATVSAGATTITAAQLTEIRAAISAIW
jgi:photosystem II stability/assembly factor-like uncharacterized protein